jgi:hypothetical protein
MELPTQRSKRYCEGQMGYNSQQGFYHDVERKKIIELAGS